MSHLGTSPGSFALISSYVFIYSKLLVETVLYLISKGIISEITNMLLTEDERAEAVRIHPDLEAVCRRSIPFVACAADIQF